MIVFLWWSLSLAAAVVVGASGHSIYANYRIRVVVEEARITAPLAAARVELTELEPADPLVALLRELLAADDTSGRHTRPRVPGSTAQAAAWAADSREWPEIRHHYLTPELQDAT